MPSLSLRAKCLYVLSLLYRWKWIRYILLTVILFLIVVCISITELRYARYINFINQDNSIHNGVIYNGKDIVSSDYRVDVRVRGGNKDVFPLQENDVVERVGDKRQRLIGMDAFADGDKASFLSALHGNDQKISRGSSESISFNLRYINRNLIGREKKEAMKTIDIGQEGKIKNVHRTLNHANDVDIISRGRTNVHLTTHLVSKEVKGDDNITLIPNYVSNNGIQRKLNTVDTENQPNLRSVSLSTPSHNKQREETRWKSNEIESTSTTEKPLHNSFPPVENMETTARTTKTNRKCTPVTNVIFLKTHKTGSSTIINIMQRYADTHNLKVALPNISHFLGWPNTFRERYVFEHSHGQKYNILCNHARFHKERMLSIMENMKDTKIVTIIRDPLYQFESTAVYLNFFALFKINRKANLLEAFFNKSKMEIFNRTKRRNTHNIFLVKNPITYDLGFPTWREEETVTEKILRKVKNDFHLVMISDYMAESLVMLQEELCWDLKDIVYFTMNRRPDKLRQRIRNVTRTRENVKNWNSIDNRIFDHYNQTFWERVRRGGTRFQQKVRKLKETNEWLQQMCLQPGRHFDKSQPWFPILGFKLKNESKSFKFRTLCEHMIRSEIDYTNLLKLKQTRFNWTVPTNPPRKKKKPNPGKPQQTKTNQPLENIKNNKVIENVPSDRSHVRTHDAG